MGHGVKGLTADEFAAKFRLVKLAALPLPISEPALYCRNFGG